MLYPNSSMQNHIEFHLDDVHQFGLAHEAYHDFVQAHWRQHQVQANAQAVANVRRIVRQHR